MKVATFKGLPTLFYDGSKPMWNRELNEEWENEYIKDVPEDEETWQSLAISDRCKRYVRERFSWKQVVIVKGVTEIPEHTFYKCYNIKRVIFADTVTRIGRWAFSYCKNLFSIRSLRSVIRIGSDAFSYCWNLTNIKLPPTLEYIGQCAFRECNLVSVFIPPTCRYIGPLTFALNRRLTIMSIPQNTELGYAGIIIEDTELMQRSQFEIDDGEEVNAWLKEINNDEQFALHRVCSSFRPTLDMILNTMKEKGGPKAFKVENSIGITPSRYLNENPYADVKEKEIIEKFILQMMGEL